jgi:hypothetical protein
LKKPAKKDFLSKRNHTLNCLINLENHLIYKNRFKTKKAKENSMIKEKINYALENNYDGVILKNIWDNKHWCTVLVVFSPKQIHILN